MKVFNWAPRQDAQSPSTSTLSGNPRWFEHNLLSVFVYRDLLWFLALRDIQVRYKQTVLGVLWAVIQPLVLMVVVRSFFGRYTGVINPIELFSALVPWVFFAGAVTASTNSLVGNASLLNKVYFPRLILPLASVGAPLMDFLIGWLVLIGMMSFAGLFYGVQWLIFPLLVGSVIITALGVGILLSAMTVSYRDFRYVVPFMLQIGFFVTPVIYDVPQWVIWINPLGGTIQAFRASVLGQPINWTNWMTSVALSVVILLVGVVFFCRSEQKFADVV